MTELERELIAISRRVDWPAEPDLAPRVRARLEARVELAVPWRRTLVIGLALFAVTIAAALAVPSARTAILRWLGLSHVRVVHVETLPPTRRLTRADLGTKTTLAAAERRLGFHVLQPRERANAVYVFAAYGNARVTLVYGSVAKPRLFLSEFRGVGSANYIQKLVGPETRVERVRVRGRPGLWVSGPHAVLYERPGNPPQVFNSEPLLAGNTLVWEARHGLTLRLEGTLTKGDAERLASSLR
jgi:hypothetical protein